MNRKAIATLVVGNDYIARWQRCCETGWRAYANRHGYDLLVWTSPLDTSERAAKRSISWQKCLVPGREEAAKYERIVWIDADVMIHMNAPDICDGVPVDAIGATDENSFPTPEIHQEIILKQIESQVRAGRPDIAELWRYFLTPQSYYESWGLPGTFNRIVQAGVLVLSPAHHRSIFEHVYSAYEDKGGASWNYEMRPLSYEIQKSTRVHWLDQRFNALLPFLVTHLAGRFNNLEDFLRGVMPQCHMAHFAGAQEWMDVVASMSIARPQPLT